MNAYGILIVDDEEEVRRGVVECVNWKDFGFQIVASAANGADALELAERLSPDLVITDIKMPYIDGLELVKRLKQMNPEIKILIITGFDEFRYVKQAIGLDVMEYIVKPINLSELREVLVRAREKMDKERLKNSNLQFLRAHYEKSLPILRENFMLSLLEGRVLEDHALTLGEANQTPLDYPYFAVACFKPDYKETIEEPLVIQFSIKRLADDSLGREFPLYSTLYMDYVVVIVCFETDPPLKLFLNAAERMVKVAESRFQVTLTAGIGRPVENPGLICQSLRQAITALDYRTVAAPGKVLYIKDIEPNENVSLRFDEANEQLLLGAIRRADEAGVTAAVKTVIGVCTDLKLSYRKFQVYLLEVMRALLSLCESFNLNWETVMGEGHPYDHVAVFDTNAEVVDYVTDVALKIAAKIKKERQTTASRLVAEAKEYIEKNYADCDLSVEGLCDVFHVSLTYFSSLFKKETGTTLINLITERRMAAARKLLLETDLKTYIIAEKSGFQDANYFSFAFKKRFGVSPTKLRSEQK